MDKIRQLLGKSHVVKALDRNSEATTSRKEDCRRFSWDTLFKVRHKIVASQHQHSTVWEAESAPDARQPVTSSVGSPFVFLHTCGFCCGRKHILQTLVERDESLSVCLVCSQSVQAVWQREAEALRRAKEATSAAALSSRNRKKQDVSALVKLVVRLADKRERARCSLGGRASFHSHLQHLMCLDMGKGVVTRVRTPFSCSYLFSGVVGGVTAGGSRNLQPSSVVSHVLRILDDEFLCSAFGVDHSAILLKDILHVKAYWGKLKQKQWQGG